MEHTTTTALRQPRWLSEKEVSAMTGISLSTLRKHRLHQVGIRFSKVGRSVRYEHDDVVQFMVDRRVEPRRPG